MLVLGIVTALAAVAWAVLLIGHGSFWRTDQRLPGYSPAGPGPAVSGPAGPGPALPPSAGSGPAVSGPVLPPSAGALAAWPEVAAVVPARDEAAILPVTLPALLAQDYPGPFSVTLVDDSSTDGTGEVAAALGAEASRPLRVVHGAAPPAGWAGKPWAMAQGLEATRAAARYVLFTDADIAWAPGALRALVTAAEDDDRDLVSQMALLRTETGWEKAIIPAFVYFFAQLYPFRWINRPGGRTAAAAGGCMLVRRAALDAAGGLAPIRAALIDDVALGRLLKHRPGRGRCWLGLTTEIRSVRPYVSLADLWNMVARSAYTQLRYSPWLLAGTLAGLAWLYALAPVSAIVGLIALADSAGRTTAVETGPLLCAVAGVAGWATMAISYLPMLRLYRLSPLRAPLLPVIAVIYAAMTADSGRRHYAGRGGSWKGRAGRPDQRGTGLPEKAHR